MKVKVIADCLIGGKRHNAGETVDVSDAEYQTLFRYNRVTLLKKKKEKEDGKS